MIEVKIKSSSGELPGYETDGAAGLDLRAYIKQDIVIAPGHRALVPTGLFIELPRGYEAQIRARSGLAVKYGIGLVNGVGTIDSDYRGEIKIAMINWGTEDFVVMNGDRIAQMVVARHETVCWRPVENLTDSQRGEGGFGHTGV